MSKHRAYPTIVYWMSAKKDCKEKRFLQVGNSLIFSPKIQKLSYGARWLYICMAMEAAGHADYCFPLASARRCGFPASSFRRYIKELQKGEFIQVKSLKNLRQPNEYHFDPAWRGFQNTQ